ncbi:MAG TPA: hypothetical protein VIL71_21940 [Spirillospora sp.]
MDRLIAKIFHDEPNRPGMSSRHGVHDPEAQVDETRRDIAPQGHERIVPPWAG